MNYNQIEENMPLPKHLITRYEEIYAKLILEFYFPNHFDNLDYTKEKPDLRNEITSIGIEVTSSMDKTERTLDSIYPRDFKYGNADERKKAETTIKKLGGTIGDDYLFYPIKNNDLTTTFFVIKNKLDKLNKKAFKKYNENNLFIFGTTHILEYKYDVLRQGIETINNHFDWSYTFDEIFIYYLPGELLCFNAKTNSIEKVLINNAYHLSIEARDILTKDYSKALQERIIQQR